MNALKVRELIPLIDDLAPFELAESWDCCGLRLGRYDARVARIAVTLDPSAEAVEQAAQLGCELLITHHPLLFAPQENMVCDRFDPKTVEAAFKNDVCLIACHTNFDSARGGVNEKLAQLAGLEDVRPLKPPSTERGFGMGAVGSVRSVSPGEVACEIAQKWNLSGYRLYDGGAAVDCVALCGGSGGNLWKSLERIDSVLYATADLRYHECLEAVDAGLSVMLCDHGEMENPPLSYFSKALAQKTGLPVHFLDLITPKRSRERWCSVERHVSA